MHLHQRQRHTETRVLKDPCPDNRTRLTHLYPLRTHLDRGPRPSRLATLPRLHRFCSSLCRVDLGRRLSITVDRRRRRNTTGPVSSIRLHRSTLVHRSRLSILDNHLRRCKTSHPVRGPGRYPHRLLGRVGDLIEEDGMSRGPVPGVCDSTRMDYILPLPPFFFGFLKKSLRETLEVFFSSAFCFSISFSFVVVLFSSLGLC